MVGNNKNLAVTDRTNFRDFSQTDDKQSRYLLGSRGIFTFHVQLSRCLTLSVISQKIDGVFLHFRGKWRLCTGTAKSVSRYNIFLEQISVNRYTGIWLHPQ